MDEIGLISLLAIVATVFLLLNAHRNGWRRRTDRFMAIWFIVLFVGIDIITDGGPPLPGLCFTAIATSVPWLLARSCGWAFRRY